MVKTDAASFPKELRVSYNLEKKDIPFEFYISPPPSPFKITATELTCQKGDAIPNLILIFKKDQKEVGRATFKDGKPVIDTITGLEIPRGQTCRMLLQSKIDFSPMIGGEFAIKIEKTG